MVNCPGIGTEFLAMTSKLGQGPARGILCYIWESWEEQRGTLRSFVGRQAADCWAMDRQKAFQAGVQRNERNGMLREYRNIKQPIETGP